MPFDVFHDLFADVVRIRCDMTGFNPSVNVTARAVTDLDEIAGWFLPWHHAPGSAVPLHAADPSVVPMTVDDVASERRVTLPERLVAIDSYGRDVIDWTVSFMAVTAVVGDRRLLLDGCHRAVAAVRFRRPDRPVRVCAFEVANLTADDIPDVGVLNRFASARPPVAA